MALKSGDGDQTLEVGEQQWLNPGTGSFGLEELVGGCFSFTPHHWQGLQTLLGSAEGAEAFWTRGEGCQGKGRRGGSPAFPLLPAVIAAWTAVITPFVRMTRGEVGLPNHTHLALSFPLCPSPAAPATGYGYPADKGAGGSGLGVPRWGHSPAHGAFISSAAAWGAEITPAPSRLPGEIRSEPAGRQSSALRHPKPEGFSSACCLFATQLAPSDHCVG